MSIPPNITYHIGEHSPATAPFRASFVRDGMHAVDVSIGTVTIVAATASSTDFPTTIATTLSAPVGHDFLLYRRGCMDRFPILVDCTARYCTTQSGTGLEVLSISQYQVSSQLFLDTVLLWSRFLFLLDVFGS